VSFPLGALIGGRYRLEQSIGSGGMGEVFRAVDTVLGRAVAVKVVHAVEPRKRKEVTESFLREARISAAIAHPNVVQILDFGIHQELAPYIVMELLAGESLADLLGRGAVMPMTFVFELILRVLEALKAAHTAGVIHRDLKPENIFLTSDRGGLSPKLLDFGISKILDSTGVAHVTTTHGHIVGTPAYMSPEQARGLKEIDQRTDVYSMGVVLYELLSGDLPVFSENPGDLLVMIMTAQEQPLGERVPQLAGPLSDLVGRAMAKRPEQRFRDAGEMLEAVANVSLTLASTGTSHSARSARANGRTTEASLALAPQTANLAPLAPAASAAHSRLGRYVVGGLALTAAALGAGAFVWKQRLSPATPQQRFIVVHADPRAADPGPVESDASDRPPPTRDTRPQETESPRPRRTATPEEALAQSFRAQRGPVVKCVNTYPDEAERSPKLTLRLTLSTTGDVSEVKLFPPELAQSPLSACIQGAARGLKFPKQSAPLMFDIPLTARKGG
jgi:serine/threonine protein kinase